MFETFVKYKAHYSLLSKLQMHSITSHSITSHFGFINKGLEFFICALVFLVQDVLYTHPCGYVCLFSGVPCFHNIHGNRSEARLAPGFTVLDPSLVSPSFIALDCSINGSPTALHHGTHALSSQQLLNKTT